MSHQLLDLHDTLTKRVENYVSALADIVSQLESPHTESMHHTLTQNKFMGIARLQEAQAILREVDRLLVEESK